MESLELTTCLLFLLLTRVCTGCKVRQHLPGYHRDSKNPSGYRARCKVCCAEKASSHYQAHKHIRKKQTRAYALAHPEAQNASKQRSAIKHREKTNAKCRQRYRENPEKSATYSRERRQTHRVTVLKIERDRRQKNALRLRITRKRSRDRHPGIYRQAEARRRAREKGLPATFTHLDEMFANQYWQYGCAVCGRENGFWHVIALDHWIPIVHPLCPGTVPGNMVPLCHAKKGAPPEQRGCNQSKSSNDPLVWLQTMMTPRAAQKKLKAIHTFLAEAQQASEQRKHAS